MIQVQFSQYRSLAFGYCLYITGDCNQLGQWQIKQAVRMKYQEKDMWVAYIELTENSRIEYKYFIAKYDNQEDVIWDSGANRVIDTKVYVLKEKALTLMTFNIRFDTDEDGKNKWENRKSIVCQIIKQVNPDILGLQEVLQHQKEFIETNLVNYNFIGRGRQSNFWGGESAPILYNILKFNLLRTEIFWLSDTPQVPASRTYGNRIPRICTYAKLQDKASNAILNVYNTHFDHEHAESQVKSAFQIKKNIEIQYSQQEQIIVMGDLNCLPLSQPVKILESEGVKLQNTMGVLDIPLATFHMWKEFKLGLHIDYIFISQNMKFNGMKILNEQIAGQYPSDHFPKVVECELQQQ